MSKSMLSAEELVFVKQFIYLPMLMSIVEKNVKELEHSQYTLKKFYIDMAGIVMDIMQKDLYAVNKEFRSRNIKVVELSSSGFDLKYQILFRGYQENFAIMKSVAKAELSVKLKEYLNSIIKQLS